MTKRLRILHLEDDPDYSTLVRDLLAKEGIDFEMVLVVTREEFDAALASGTFDVILADYSLPSWTGLQALGLARQKVPQTPFLLVSGTIGEQAAIESLRAGATDYVLKQWPERLAPAVIRAVEEARERLRRQHAETELIRREKFFRALTSNSLDLLTILNREGAYQYHSPSVKRVLGYDPRELAGRNVFELIHPEDLPRVRAAFQHGLAHPDQTVTLAYRIRHRDGRWIYLEVVGQNRLEDPDIAGVIVNSRDISERKRLEAQHSELASLGRELSSVTEEHEAAQLIQATADRLFDWDVFTLDLYSPETGLVHPVLDIDTIGGKRVSTARPGVSHPASALARRVMAQGAELILRQPPLTMLPEATPFGDTSRPSASLMLTAIRERGRVIGILAVHSYKFDAYTPQDLQTLQILADHCGGALERIHQRERLRESEQRFRDLFAGSPDAIFVEDLEGNVLDANPAACRLHGLTSEQIVGRNVSELVPLARREEVARDFAKLVSGELTWLEGESLAADGKVTPVEVRTGRIQYAGKPAILLHVRDLSERKQAESALRSSEMLFHSVWENSVDGMRLTDEHGRIVAVNDAYCQMVGMNRVELEGRPMTVVYADSEEPERMLARYQERFRDRVMERQIERRLTLRNGSVVILECTNSFVELRGQPPLVLGMFRDVTAQKRLEEQFRQAQKMDAIGQLAGGVAHDFNNILTVIHGHASLLLAGANLTGLAAKSAQQIVHAAERAAGLTRQLLTFSRRQVMQPRRLDLNEVVGNMTKMLDRILGEDITLEVSPWPQLALVHADASMMEQVVLNLAVNARDAMPKGGRLRLQIEVLDVNEAHVAEHPEARPGRFVRLTAADTGCGIDTENLRRIFEPFFTTKQVGKGTGLGLATVYGVVKQHQGWIEVESTVGQGATFRVYLPNTRDLADPTEVKPSESVVRGGQETILVVEDEQPVRELVCNLLQQHGYRILEAESGRKALEVWRSHKDVIDLVLTDLVMPDGINGRELAEQLWQEQPDLKVIFTSGYSADVVGKEFVLRRELNYLQKPYHPEKLALAVRDCLDSSGPPASN